MNVEILPLDETNSYWGAEDWDRAEAGEAVGEMALCWDCKQTKLVKRCPWCWCPTCFDCSQKSDPHGIC